MRRSPTIEFLCQPEDRGVIAEPIPARNELPAWFRQLPGVDRDHLFAATNDGVTVKASDFLNALGTGWIIPLAATVRLEVRDDGKHVEAGWEFDRPMVSNHSAFQISGHPAESPSDGFTTTGPCGPRQVGAAFTYRPSTGRTGSSR